MIRFEVTNEFQIPVIACVNLMSVVVGPYVMIKGCVGPDRSNVDHLSYVVE